MLGTSSSHKELLDPISVSGKAGWSAEVWRTTTTAGKGLQITLDVSQPVAVVLTYALVP
jgi:hypothetical protein